jgi:hypothetical protein
MLLMMLMLLMLLMLLVDRSFLPAIGRVAAASAACAW